MMENTNNDTPTTSSAECNTNLTKSLYLVHNFLDDIGIGCEDIRSCDGT
jgi:hypothetical protein